MFKSFLSIPFVFFFLISTSSQAAIMEVDGVETEVGDLDTLLFSGDFGSRFDDQVLTIESFLGLETGSLNMEELVVEETGHVFTQTFNSNDSFLTYDFGSISDSEYFMLSLMTDVNIHHNYFFDNRDDMQFAYISLNDMFSYPGNIPYAVTTNTAGDFDFKVSRITHVATVSEPAMITLFGLGLIGLGLSRRQNRS